jgi:hypothetical protein
MKRRILNVVAPIVLVLSGYGIASGNTFPCPSRCQPPKKITCLERNHIAQCEAGVCRCVELVIFPN